MPTHSSTTTEILLSGPLHLNGFTALVNWHNAIQTGLLSNSYTWTVSSTLNVSPAGPVVLQQCTFKPTLFCTVLLCTVLQLPQAGDNRLSPSNTALILLDHQTGLFELVRDYGTGQHSTAVSTLPFEGHAICFSCHTLPVMSYDS